MNPATPPALDEVIQHPTRLAMMGFLAGCAEAEFSALRDYCQISDASVSRLTSVLEAAGYVKVRKGYVGKRPRTWLSLTSTGQVALEGHVAALRAIVDDALAAGSALDGADDVRASE